MGQPEALRASAETAVKLAERLIREGGSRRFDLGDHGEDAEVVDNREALIEAAAIALARAAEMM